MRFDPVCQAQPNLLKLASLNDAPRVSQSPGVGVVYVTSETRRGRVQPNRFPSYRRVVHAPTCILPVPPSIMLIDVAPEDVTTLSPSSPRRIPKTSPPRMESPRRKHQPNQSPSTSIPLHSPPIPRFLGILILLAATPHLLLPTRAFYFQWSSTSYQCYTQTLSWVGGSPPFTAIIA